MAGVPAMDEYQMLRTEVGWRESFCRQLRSGAQALGSTVFGVTASRTDGLAVGMARVIGDTGVYLFVVDVVVSPAEQNIGRWSPADGPGEELGDGAGAPHVALVADPSVAGFCEPWGFREQAAL
jgi:hypothetical protein